MAAVDGAPSAPVDRRGCPSDASISLAIEANDRYWHRSRERFFIAHGKTIFDVVQGQPKGGIRCRSALALKADLNTSSWHVAQVPEPVSLVIEDEMRPVSWFVVF